MGNCNINCCKCIEKKETQYNQISNRSNKTSSNHKNKLKQNMQIDYSHIFIIQENNEENKKAEKNTLNTLEEDKYSINKRNNESIYIDINNKDVSFKYSKKTTKDKFYNPNNRYQNMIDTFRRKEIEKENNINLNIDKINDNKLNNESNQEEDVVINEIKSPPITPRYLRPKFNTAKNSPYSKCFERIEDCKKNLEQTEKLKNRPYRITHFFPIKYNYQKDKYITYFTDDNL